MPNTTVSDVPTGSSSQLHRDRELMIILQDSVRSFLAATQYYLGNHQPAIEVRKSLGLGNPFIATLHSKLLQLDSELSNEKFANDPTVEVVTKIEIVLHILQKCLSSKSAVLNRSISTKSFGEDIRQKYKRLLCFLTLVNDDASSQLPFEKLLASKLEYRDLFSWKNVGQSISRKNALFANLASLRKYLSIPPTNVEQEDIVQQRNDIRMPLPSLRSLSQSSFQTLNLYHKCVCNPPLSKIYLAFNRHIEKAERVPSLEMYLERANDDQWCQCTIEITKSRTKRVHYVDRPATNIQNLDEEHYEDVLSICSLAHQPVRPTLLFKLDALKNALKVKVSDQLFRPASRNSLIWIRLADLISGSGLPITIQDVRLCERIALAVMIANGFLHLYESRWWPEHWEVGEVYLSYDEKSGLLNCRKPYLLTNLEFQTQDAMYRQMSVSMHPYPHIDRLGTILMELMKGRCMDSAEDKSDFLDGKGEMMPAYHDAVVSCAEVQTFPRGVPFADEGFRQAFWEKIVLRLERGYETGFELDVSNILAVPQEPEAIFTKRAVQKLKQIRLRGYKEGDFKELNPAGSLAQNSLKTKAQKDSVCCEQSTQNAPFVTINALLDANHEAWARSYGSTSLSGSGPAHLGDTNFNAPINIHKLVLSNYRYDRAGRPSALRNLRRSHSASHLPVLKQ